MFRLMKLAIYGLLGYAIYEFVRGITQGRGAEALGMGGGQGGSRELNRALNEDPVRSNMTGPARGQRVVSEEPSGESVPHMVGRGVVRR